MAKVGTVDRAMRIRIAVTPIAVAVRNSNTGKVTPS